MYDTAQNFAVALCKNGTPYKLQGETPMPSMLYRLASKDDGHYGGHAGRPFVTAPGSGEDLPYKVELWNEDKSSIEQVLAITASGSVGYGAYYAATREFPTRYITLRHKTNILSRWNGPEH